MGGNNHSAGVSNRSLAPTFIVGVVHAARAPGIGPCPCFRIFRAYSRLS